jgi:hypothetical protein
MLRFLRRMLKRELTDEEIMLCMKGAAGETPLRRRIASTLSHLEWELRSIGKELYRTESIYEEVVPGRFEKTKLIEYQYTAYGKLSRREHYVKQRGNLVLEKSVLYIPPGSFKGIEG